MKIEKVNENQIRCTLTREDLISRELKISELAYGTEKAKNLFRDMMRQANFEFGFEAEDIPLMIEAIPLNAECIVLIITKVEDPEELDTRFSRFAPSVTEEDLDDGDDYPEAAENEVLDLFHRVLADGKRAAEETVEKDASGDAGRSRLFRISSLRQVMTLSRMLAAGYKGMSALYKDEKDDGYLLLLTQGADTEAAFDRACNVVSEYGALQRMASGSETYLAEHCDTLIAADAIQALGISD